MRRTAIRLVALAGAVLIVGAAFVSPAFGWTVTVGDSSSRIYRVDRESDDGTGSVDVHYYEVSGFPSYAQRADGSFDSTAAGGTFAGATDRVMRFDAGCDTGSFYSAYSDVLFAFPDGTRQVALSGNAQIPVYLATSNSATPSIDVRIVSSTATLPVSSSATMSVAGTIPATVEGLAGFDRDSLEVAGYALLFVLGLALYRGVRLGR